MRLPVRVTLALLLTGVAAQSARATVAEPVPALPYYFLLPNASALRGCDAPASSPALLPRDARTTGAGDPNPLAGETFFIDPTEPSWRDAVKYRQEGDDAKAELMGKIAFQPKFTWFGKFNHNIKSRIDNYLTCQRLIQPGSVPLMVVLRAQAKRCNPSYTGGGKKEDAATRKWYRDYADAIGSTRVVIGFEVDSLGTLECLKKSRRKPRLKLLRYGVSKLAKLPNATL